MPAKRKSSKRKPATTRANKKRGESKWKSFAKYATVVLVSSIVAIFLFTNRHIINKEVEEKVSIVKGKVLAKEKVAVKKKNKTVIGYDKKDRAGLESLINEEIE